MSRTVRLFVEETPRKVFASALDWPGLARGAKTEDLAIELLLAAMPRYAKVARRAGERFDPTDLDIEVSRRVEGDYGSAYGIPSMVAPEDREPVDAREAKRLAAIVEAAWTEFDRVAASAPESLRKGPRGGGRDRTKIVEHVDGADTGYASAIGLRHKADTREQVEALRADVLATLRTPSDGSPLAGRKWPARYAARRIAWHALDHAWEIEDRTEPA
ncbi:MAG TPA: hypothetical protein VFQ75_05320 [Candidatus Limnocylindrales bacterium]|nr:hypothetical protein [Candidatus Limnocylindrales bacterium]